MAGGLSAAQHVCKYDLFILEAFLIDNTIAKENCEGFAKGNSMWAAFNNQS